ncbi:hypothetical protein [Streptomonospora arabica]|uniref:Oligopeptide transport permease C-like N-terminal domain-containing protein n=1 Tax=Streptomonospora arabica TaxID=412417 RepID=A0ABV9SU68_9ACTN
MPCSGPREPVSAGELSDMYPGLDLVSVLERHPFRIGFAITGAVLVAVFATMLAAWYLPAF